MLYCIIDGQLAVSIRIKEINDYFQCIDIYYLIEFKQKFILYFK